MNRWFAVGIGLLVNSTIALADVRLPALFADGAVLQRDKPIAVWGWADAGEKVSITLDGSSIDAVADEAGNWKATLPPHAAGEGLQLHVSGKNQVQRTDISVGEVWICSGQSNMEFQVRQTTTADEAAKSAEIAGLRLFRLDKITADQRAKDCKGKWIRSTPENVATFSAVGFYFGKALQAKLGVPVGLIQSSWGGTPAEAWTNRSSLEAVARLKPIFDHAVEMAAAVPKTQAVYEQRLADYDAAVARAKASGGKAPAKLKRPAVLQQEKYPSTLFNGMVAPIAGFGVRGVLWYQGEANVKRHAQYQVLLPVMIDSWRKAWHDESLPFALVQLPKFGPISDAAVEDAAWPAQRESQALVAKSVANVDYISNIDLGDPDDEHAKLKTPFGERLCHWALAKVYRQNDVDWAGPRCDSMTVEGSTIRVHLRVSHPPLKLSRGDKPMSFAVAGADQKFVPATATIANDEMLIHADAVPQPKAARYAWKNSPEVNVVDSEGLPLAPFRTDTWPLQNDVAATSDSP